MLYSEVETGRNIELLWLFVQEMNQVVHDCVEKSRNGVGFQIGSNYGFYYHPGLAMLKILPFKLTTKFLKQDARETIKKFVDWSKYPKNFCILSQANK